MSEENKTRKNYLVTAGTDEAGRGPLAGPVVAAAVILTQSHFEILLSLGLRDSKKLSPKKREIIFEKMCDIGVPWRAQAASPRVIDKINILNASLWCMKRSVERLPLRPQLVMVDGNRSIPGLAIPQRTIIGGDDTVPAIAAASVAAKVLRDRVMTVLDRIYPEYQFSKHKGYPTALHKSLIAEFGASCVHRMTFKMD